MNKIFQDGDDDDDDGWGTFQDHAFARTPENYDIFGDDQDGEGDWSFFQAHYQLLLQVTVAWGKYYGKGDAPPPAAQFTFDSGKDEGDLLEAVEAAGGTHLTIASVWYVLVVGADAFNTRSKSPQFGIQIKSDASHQHLFWWLDAQLLTMASTALATGTAHVITLPAATPLADTQANRAAKAGRPSDVGTALGTSAPSPPPPPASSSPTNTAADVFAGELRACQGMMGACGADHAACVGRYHSVFYGEAGSDSCTGALSAAPQHDVVEVDEDM